MRPGILHGGGDQFGGRVLLCASSLRQFGVADEQVDKQTQIGQQHDQQQPRRRRGGFAVGGHDEEHDDRQQIANRRKNQGDRAPVPGHHVHSFTILSSSTTHL